MYWRTFFFFFDKVLENLYLCIGGPNFDTGNFDGRLDKGASKLRTFNTFLAGVD